MDSLERTGLPISAVDDPKVTAAASTSTTDSLGNDFDSVFKDRAVIVEDSLERALDEDPYDTLSVNFQSSDTLNLVMGGGNPQEESDPVFSASAAASITASDISKWDNSGIYTNLEGKPKINDIELIGNQKSSDLGLQDKLESGVNIKTINSQSILGKGNIVIEGGSGGTDDYSELTNKPKINNIELEGNKTLSDLGINNFDGDYNNLSNKPDIPTKTSDLSNDSGFVTNSYHDSTKVDKVSGKSLIEDTKIAKLNEIEEQANKTIINNTTSSTSTTEALSANMGKELQDEIDNLKARGRFLALWNAETGLAMSNPTTSPYTYKTGDYYIISAVSATTNYKPNGATYTIGVASTTVESNSIAIDDVYYYDGTNWRLQTNTQKTTSFANIAGLPNDNTNLASALNSKQAILVSGTNIKTINNSSILGSGDITISSGPEIDNSSIVKNSNDEIQTIGVIDQKTGNTNKEWTGTLSEYNAIDEKDLNTLYYITDEAISYNDLSNKPTIPSKVSELTNDKGYLTEHQDISGKENTSNKSSSYTTSSTTTYPNTKALVDGLATKQATLAAQTAYSEKGSATKVPQITTNALGQVTKVTEVTITQPTKVSELTNDSGYTTNTGTVTSVGVKMNGTTKGTVTGSGTIDLGTVCQLSYTVVSTW